MSEHLSTPMIDRLRLGDLAPKAEADMHEHVATCSKCGAKLKEAEEKLKKVEERMEGCDAFF